MYDEVKERGKLYICAWFGVCVCGGEVCVCLCVYVCVCVHVYGDPP